MSSFDLLPDLAARLDRLVPAEHRGGEWAEVLRRVQPMRRRRRLVVKLAVAAAAVLAFAAVATAMYLALTGSSTPKPGALTVIDGGGSSGVAGSKIVEVLPHGRKRVLWHCPKYVFCGELTAVDWSPDGRHVAFTLDEIGGTSAYVGLHILDIATGRDLHFPHIPLAHPLAPQPVSIFPRLHRAMQRQLGCLLPRGVDWSSDGDTLAYDCLAPGHVGAIFTVRSDGRGRRRIGFGGAVVNAGQPSWSPDGKRIAFTGSGQDGFLGVYVSGVDGSNTVRVARRGYGPDWSPDGRTIVYRADDGIRLVTPGGVDVTPGREPIAPKGLPAWSPDGKTIAVGTERGVFLVENTGANLRKATTAGRGVIGTVRPAWYPAESPRGDRPSALECGPC